MHKYDLIVIDPPWPIQKIKRGCRPNQLAALDYPVMSYSEIKDLPVGALAEDNSVIFLWTIQKFLPQSFALLEKWGFRYQRTITWDKQNGMCLFGFHHRSEFILFGYRGRLSMYPKRPAVPTVFTEKSGQHSKKPDGFYRLVEPFGKKRIDLFARKEREGWDVFGNEAPNSICLPAP